MDMEVLRNAGVDIEAGIRRFMGDETLYQQVLSMFLDDTAGRRAVDAMASANYRELFSCAHELKGVSGNLAMTALYQTSSKLTELLRDGNYVEPAIRAAYDAMKTEYDRVREAISKGVE